MSELDIFELIILVLLVLSSVSILYAYYLKVILDINEKRISNYKVILDINEKRISNYKEYLVSTYKRQHEISVRSNYILELTENRIEYWKQHYLTIAKWCLIHDGEVSDRELEEVLLSVFNEDDLDSQEIDDFKEFIEYHNQNEHLKEHEHDK